MNSSFAIALENVLVTLMYIVPGFLVCKAKKTLPQHLPGLSGVLIYICSPCMVLNALFEQDMSWKLAGDMALFFALSMAAMALFMLLVRIVLKKTGGDRILSAAAVMGNVGFFGLPIVKALLPDLPQASAFSIVYIVSMNILVFTVGIYLLTGDRKYISLKSALLNPSVLSFLTACVLCLAGVPAILPATVRSSVKLVGNMCTPMCLFILGVRLAKMPFRRIFLCTGAWISAGLKLLAFPLFACLITAFLPVDPAIRTSLLILSGAPCASILFNLAEMHESNRELTADCCLLSTLVCFLTIPLLTLLM